MAHRYRYLIVHDGHTHFKEFDAENDVHASVLANLDDDIVTDEYNSPVLFRQFGNVWDDVRIERSDYEG